MKQPKEILDLLDASHQGHDVDDIVFCVASPKQQKATGLLFPVTP